MTNEKVLVREKVSFGYHKEQDCPIMVGTLYAATQGNLMVDGGDGDDDDDYYYYYYYYYSCLLYTSLGFPASIKILFST